MESEEEKVDNNSDENQDEEKVENDQEEETVQEEIKDISSVDYKRYKGNFLSSPLIHLPLIDIAPIYTFNEIIKMSNQKEGGKGKSKLKVTETNNEVYPKYTCFDIKLNGRGFAEDETYLKNIDILKNIRRGNTYIRYHDSDENEKVIVGRKGMIKFYDIFREMLENGAELKELKTKNKSKVNENQRQAFTTMNITMAGVYKSLKDGYKVEAVKTLKANGENAQISYSTEIGMWIFSSKNVALLAKSEKDLEIYRSLESTMRYQFSILIAETWFKKVQEIESNGVDIEELKKDLDGKNLIGEYVGDPNHKHLVIYPKIRILFYTIVDNNSPNTCLLPEESYSFFKKYQLDSVTFESLGLFETYADIIDTLRLTYSKISSESIATGEEGSVIYFVRRRSDPETQEQDKVLSLGKLKTLEYRFYRKLREKLAGTIARNDKSKEKNKKNSFEGMLKNYKKEIKELTICPFSEKSLIEKEKLKYYEELAEKAVEIILDDSSALSNVREDYLDFLERLIEEFSSDSIKLTSSIFDIQNDIEYKKP